MDAPTSQQLEPVGLRVAKLREAAGLIRVSQEDVRRFEAAARAVDANPPPTLVASRETLREMRRLACSLPEERVLRAIYQLTRMSRGIPPSLRELCVRLRWSSTNAVASHLETLEARGFVRRRPRVTRSVQLTELGLRRIGKAAHLEPEPKAAAPTKRGGR